LSKKIVWLVVVLMFCLFSAASAMEISPMWAQFISIDNDITIQSNGQALMSASFEVRSNVQKVIISSYLQRYENDSWTTIKYWTEEFQDDIGFWSESYYVTKGYNYRLVTYFHAYDGTSWEAAELVTKPQYY